MELSTSELCLKSVNTYLHLKPGFDVALHLESFISKRTTEDNIFEDHEGATCLI